MEINKISMWRGKPIDSLSREEMLEAINYCANEIQLLKKDRDRWQKAGDAIKYLMLESA